MFNCCDKDASNMVLSLLMGLHTYHVCNKYEKYIRIHTTSMTFINPKNTQSMQCHREQFH